MISYGRQTIEEDDIEAVTEALRSDFLTQGPRVDEFEAALAAYTGAKYAVACSNGTAALHIACLAADIGEGDGVVTSPMTFLASSNSALYVGANVHFVDIDPATFNIDTARLEEKIRSNPGIKAVVPVHFAGLPCDMAQIGRIAMKYGLTVIEDACHALGAQWMDENGAWHKTGSCGASTMTVFSFHPVKAITTGEGGAVTTNDKKTYERLKELRSHGVTKNPGLFKDPSERGARWYYEMQSLGFNFRLSDIQAALGLSQLKKLDRFISRRNEIAGLYDRMFSRFPFIKTPIVKDGYRSAYHLYPVRIAFDELNISKARWFDLMRDIGIALQVHYIPVHLQPYYRERFGYKAGDYPAAERFYRDEVSLPIYPGLTDEEAAAVADGLMSTLAYAAAQGTGAAPGTEELKASGFDVKI